MSDNHGDIRLYTTRATHALHSRFEPLRQLFFASAVTSATRYGVSFDRLAAHLEVAEALEQSGQARGIRYLDDLVLAVACIDHDARAWSDFVERYERPLTARLARNMDEIDATILTRRTLVELRKQTVSGEATGLFTLVRYTGHRSLRSWISERSVLVSPEASKANVTVQRRAGTVATRGKTGTADIGGNSALGRHAASRISPVPYLRLAGTRAQAGERRF